MYTNSLFKKCQNCGRVWRRREDFLEDPEIRTVGYQVNRQRLLNGLFYFHHECFTTLAIEVRHFRDLYIGTVHPHFDMGSENCPGYCAIRDSFNKCTNLCEGNFAREILYLIRDWPKKCECSDCHCQDALPLQIQI